MSGFEVIGVVLAMWPLVVNGIEGYKMAKSGQGWGLLYIQFRTERWIYVDCIRHLLASELSEAEIAQLTGGDKPNTPLLQDAAVQRALSGKLGSEKSQLVLEIIQDMDILLTSLSEKMQKHQIPSDARHQKLQSFIRHLKLLQDRSKDDLKQLRTYNKQLQKLTFNLGGPSIQNLQVRSREAPPNLDKDVLSRITAQAHELHDAICKGYNCICRHPHEANLGTLSAKDRGPKEPFELVFPVSEIEVEKIVGQNPTSPLSLESHSDSMSISSSRGWSHKGSHRGSIDTLPSSIFPTSPLPSPPFRSRTFSLSKCNEIEDGGLIQDLCNFIKNLGDSSPATEPVSCLGVLGVEKRRYAVKVTSLGSESTEPDLVCLGDYFSPLLKKEFTRKRRMNLALSLSLAILQCYTTPWIDMWWTWKDFSALKGSHSQIYVTKRFYSTHSPLMSSDQTAPHSPLATAFWGCVGEPVLTRLGFALVELALGKSLSEIREETMPGLANEDMLDLLIAKQQLENGRVRDETNQTYHDAVHACLVQQVMMDTGYKALTSKHDDFQLDMQKYVVAPIRADVEESWGLLAT